MKKVLFCFVLILGFVLPAFAEDFVKIKDDENYLMHLDIDSVKQITSDGNDYIVAWVKLVPRGETLERVLKRYKLESMEELFAFSKDIMRWQVLAARIYDEEGKLLHDASYKFSPDDYKEIAPGTYGEWIYQHVMFAYRQNAIPASIFPAFRYLPE